VGFYWIENRAELKVRNYSSESDWRRNLVKELTSRKIDVILDAGANSGQYATGLRHSEFAGRIVSFEPLSGPFARLAHNAAADPLWDCRQYALGDDDTMISMNVAGNGAASSSILPMLQSHRDAFPRANYVSTEDVEIRRLDAVAPEVLRPNDAAFLKIDVQGFEKHVIAGGETTIKQHCAGMQVELSFAPLYDGDMLVQDALDLVDSLGFVLAGLAPGFIDVRNGRVLQADGVFFRADD
jgi:FkbM family methyltransferase